MLITRFFHRHCACLLAQCARALTAYLLKSQPSCCTWSTLVQPVVLACVAGLCVGMGRLPPANPMQLAKNELGSDDQTLVAEADPGPVMPNLIILLLALYDHTVALPAYLFLLYTLYLVAEKYAHVLP